MTTYDNEVTLISIGIGSDVLGNQIPIEEVSVILCSKKSVSRSEFYAASANGLKPKLLLTIHTYEYSGQTALIFEGTRYEVIKTYEPSFEEIELTCEPKIGKGVDADGD